jgi:hypothetical protein
VPVHVVAGDRVGDALKAERRHDPVKQLGRIVHFDGVQDAGLKQLGAEVIDQGRTACQAANRVDEAERVGVALTLLGQSHGRLAPRT